jgi:pimeloyl-ACP methyl ester carboxylesterase
MAVTATDGPHETTVRVQGLELFVRERGDGSPLLMVNGLGANVEMWGPVEERLSACARTIVFDAPGTGRSTTPLWPQSIPASAAVVEGLLDELGHERVDVLGFSLGGLVAQELARRAPQRVRRLVLAGTAVGWGSMPGTLPALALMAMPARYYSRALSEQTNWLLSPADQALLRRLTTLTEARLRHPPSLLGYTGQFWAAALWSSLRWLPSVRVPTLVVHGEADNLVPPANGVQLARLLPDARLHVLPGEGHFIVFDPESAALPLLEDFFSAPTPASSAAWSSGTLVDDDATVDAAFGSSVGAQPYRALSTVFRRLVQPAAPNGHASARPPATRRRA